MIDICPGCNSRFKSRYDVVDMPSHFKSDFLKYQCASCLEDYRDIKNGDFAKREAEAKVQAAAKDLATRQEIERSAELAKALGNWDSAPIDVIKHASANIVLTTSFSITGREIDHEIDIISAECVYGMNIFRDVFNNFRDFFGGRSGASQKVLRDAKNVALSELKREALMVFADGVIGVNLAYSELSGGGKNGMLMIVASGTAFKLKPQR